MTLDWKKHKNPSCDRTDADETEYWLYLTEVLACDDNAVSAAITLSIDKAVSLLEDNINDSSRYLMFEWDIVHSTFNIAVTNDKKDNDSPSVVQCYFLGLAEKIKAIKKTAQEDHNIEVSRYAEEIKDITRDYLTTCPAFFRYSLVAIFHTDGRSNSVLL